MQPTNTAGVWTPDHGAGAEPVKMQKRIGSTVYEVHVYFSQDARETMDDKILRMIRGEVYSGRLAG